jgi:hypothetical protein
MNRARKTLVAVALPFALLSPLACQNAAPPPAPDEAPVTTVQDLKHFTVPARAGVEYRQHRVVSWGFADHSDGVIVVSGLGARDDILFSLKLQRSGDDLLVTSEHSEEAALIKKDGTVERLATTRGPSRLAALGGLKADVEVWQKENVLAYDCASSTLAYYAALLTQAAACLIPEPVEPWACAAATLAAAAAANAMNADCAPQYCYADWQCGSGSVCSGGACVTSSICYSCVNVSCGWDYSCPVSVYCGDCGGGGGGGGGGGCYSDWDCGGGYCDWYYEECEYNAD